MLRLVTAPHFSLVFARHQCLYKHIENPTPLFRFSSTLSEQRESPLPNSQNPEVEKNSTEHALFDDDVAQVPDNDAVKRGHDATMTGLHTTRSGRKHSLRPILIPPSIPWSPLLPTTPIPSRHQNTKKEDSSSTSITLTGLPLHTVKSDIRPVFKRFGEITRILLHLDGRRADVVFADVHGVKRTLRAYADGPLRVRGREITVFRKLSTTNGGGMEENDMASGGANTGIASPTTRTEDGHEEAGIFVSDFPWHTTKEELSEVLEPLGKYERLAMRPDSKYAFFIYSNADRVEQILSIHRRVPITLRGRILRLERAENRPYGLPPKSSGIELGQGRQPDPATSAALLEEFMRTVPRFRGLHDPSRVLWVGRLPSAISRLALVNFWSRLGCVVDVRLSLHGFAHIEFASTEEALRAVSQGAPHGFRHGHRLLDLDFARWIFYPSHGYRVLYIYGWPASSSRPGLMRWSYDIPNVTGVTVLPPFRGEKRTDPRCAFLQFGEMDDAHTALRMLDGRVGPGGETLQLGLSRAPVVHPNQMWGWAYQVQDMANSDSGEEGERCLEDGWGGLGFGTGKEEQDDQGVDQWGRGRADLIGGQMEMGTEDEDELADGLR